MPDPYHRLEYLAQLILAFRTAEFLPEQRGEEFSRPGVPRYGKRLDQLSPPKPYRQVQPPRVEVGRGRGILRIRILPALPSRQLLNDRLPLRPGRVPVLRLFVDAGGEVR